MRSSRAIRVFLPLILILLLLSSCGHREESGQDLFQALRSHQEEQQDGQEQIVILLSHSATEDRPTHQAALCFKQQLEELSQGAFYVEIYPNDTLGNVMDNASSFSSSPVQMRIGLGDSTPLMKLCILAPVLGELSLPELDALFQTGELRELLEAQYEENGVKLLETLPSEYRYLACDQAITSLEDFQSLKIRVPVADDSNARYWQALGAETLTVDIKQLHIALQQGTVNAHESTLPVILGQKLYPYQHYLIRIPHRIYFDTMIMNLDFFNGLTAEQQDWVLQAASTARVRYQLESQTYLEKNQAVLEDYGIQNLLLSPTLNQTMRQYSLQYELPELEDQLGTELFERVCAMLRTDLPPV